MTPGVQAVLFDLDGVLVDSERLAGQVWVRLLAQHGLTLSEADFLAGAVGTTHAALHDWLHGTHGWQRPDGFDDQMRAALAETFARVPEVPGAAATLRGLRAAGLPYAVASNSLRERLHLKLQAAGLNALVGQHAYDPAHVGGRGKPLPDLYLYAAGQLGAEPGRCVVVEDSATGVQAGVAAGATVWGFVGGGHSASPEVLWAAGVSRVIGSHAELLAALTDQVQTDQAVTTPAD